MLLLEISMTLSLAPLENLNILILLSTCTHWKSSLTNRSAFGASNPSLIWKALIINENRKSSFLGISLYHDNQIEQRLERLIRLWNRHTINHIIRHDKINDLKGFDLLLRSLLILILLRLRECRFTYLFLSRCLLARAG